MAWWRAIRWPIIALIGWCVAGVFIVVVGIQHAELDKRHLHVEWGM
jgi:hypothetical protein